MTNFSQIKTLMRAILPEQFQEWLWNRKVTWGNRRVLVLQKYLSTRIHDLWLKDMDQLESIDTQVGWEQFRDERMDALYRLLKMNEASDDPPYYRVMRTLEQDGYRIDNLVYDGHREISVTANIYKPILSLEPTPAVIICHSHHASKTDEELQSMGRSWAKQGCTVLILDLLGHGERRQHPFVKPCDYEEPFRVGRQDYYFRYVLGMQLGLIDESIMGWMVQDVRRGINLLCADPWVDQKSIIVIGSVAGGGDIAAVVGAMDKRVSAVVAFNYGHLSLGDWDPTRSLPNTARYGFWPWLILASLAPRRLIYAREFSHDYETDPVWKCLQKVYGFYDRRSCLRSIHGSGHVSGHSPIDSHCTNVGSVHRAQLSPILREWFDIPVFERQDAVFFEDRELECWTGESAQIVPKRRVQEVAQDICHDLLNAARVRRESQLGGSQLVQLQDELINQYGAMTAFSSCRERSRRKGIGLAEHIVLEVDGHVNIRLCMLWPPDSEMTHPPIILAFAQQGNRRLRSERRPLIQTLLSQGIIVCLTELRGTGDGRDGELYRGRISPSARLAATSSMLGESVLGSRVRDLRTVLAYLKNRSDIDASRVGLWGDSLSNTNHACRDIAVPLDAEPDLEQGEPLGGTVALLTALFEPDIRAVYMRGGLISYASLLDEQFVYHAADALLPGLLRIADLPDIAAALAPLPIRTEELVDGANRLVSHEVAQNAYGLTTAAYDVHRSHEKFLLHVEHSSVNDISTWLSTFLLTD